MEEELSLMWTHQDLWRRWPSGRGRVIPPCRSGFDSRRQHPVLALGVQGCGGVHSMLTAGIIRVKGPLVVTCT